jgi:putative transposase
MVDWGDFDLHASAGHLMTFVLQPLLAMLASLTHQELARQVVFLRVENCVLRSRLPTRIGVTPCERSRLLALGSDLRTLLRGLVSVVCYGIFLPLRREAKAAHLTHKQPAQRVGRPRTAGDIPELLMRLARENSWGYTCILGELRKLGITHISRQTVKAILKAHGISPVPDRGGGKWTEFIRPHAATHWQYDFLSKPIWTLKGLVNLYKLVFLYIGPYRLRISSATRRPDAV